MHDSNKFRLQIPRWAMLLSLVWLTLLGPAAAEQPTEQNVQQAVARHRIEIKIDPASGTLSATDRLTLPSEPSGAEDPEASARASQTQTTTTYVLQLHAGLELEVSSGNARLQPVARRGHLARYVLEAAPGSEVELRYQGRIRHDFDAIQEGMGRARQQSIGTISPDGVFLSGYSGWYPRVSGSLETLSLAVNLPSDWLAVSQGAGPTLSAEGPRVRVGWRETAPQDELYLIAAPFKLYRESTDTVEAQAFLRSADDELAARYLEATASYLERYTELIGPYPYAKFALVENFWETGYGMPSFTLLGPRVLRLPFILHSSYPHEILHNWWGNGVYVDDTQGNWSEGLTAYLADHLNQELAGKGADYRRDQLKAFTDYVRDHQDEPLTQFRGRHGAASQAIGYGKALMLFHMLRVKLGDAVFVEGLRHFYQHNRFSKAGWDQLEAAFEAESGQELSAFFSAWTSRPGAPLLALAAIEVEPLPDGRWRLSGRLEQTQSEAPFPMTVPVMLLDENGTASELEVWMQEDSTAFSTLLDTRPVHLAVDPRFDSFRQLAAGEATATLSNLFGAERGLILIPSEAPAALRRAYRQLAESWQRGQSGWSIVLDKDLEQLPTDRAIWLLGWRNQWLEALSALGLESGQFRIDPDQQQASLLGTEYSGKSPVISTHRGEQTLGWVATDQAEAVSGLARKLPHYGKYGYLVFEGPAPTNIAKGQWPAGESSLTRWLGEHGPQIAYPERAYPARPSLLETAAQRPKQTRSSAPSD
ncbi:M1 family metallopeptidase [Halochromatium sp.]